MSTTDGVFDRTTAGGLRVDVERVAKWLVGGRLSSVLHVGDGSLAYHLSRQGHEVVVAGPNVERSRSDEITYVRSSAERLPFAPSTFDAVVVPQLSDATTVLAEHARVLRPGGLLSTVARTYDDTVPWMRRLREIVGTRPATDPPVRALVASGLFETPEVEEFAAWEELDLGALLQFARATGRPHLAEHELAAVHALFTADAGHTGSLRLRHRTQCVRARVDKADVPQEAPPETFLLDLR